MKRFFGLCTCPECGSDQAEVKETKAGLAYRWCPDCRAQYFPKKAPASDRLISTVRPGTETAKQRGPEVPQPEQKPEPKAAPETPPPVQEQKPERKPTKLFGDFANF